eukprot:2114552-Ditylum_brightwellii.AAC.1
MESHPIHPHVPLHQQDGSNGLSETAPLTATTSQKWAKYILSVGDTEKENQKKRSTEKTTILFEKFGAGGESTCVGTALCDAI